MSFFSVAGEREPPPGPTEPPKSWEELSGHHEEFSKGLEPRRHPVTHIHLAALVPTPGDLPSTFAPLGNHSPTDLSKSFLHTVARA